MQLVTQYFGGAGAFSGMLTVVGVAQAPLVFSGLVQLSIVGLQVALGPQNTAADVAGLLSRLLGLLALMWFVVLVVIGATLAPHIGYGESAGSCAISCAG